MFPRLAAVALGAALFLVAAVPTGALYITTLPSGADVWIDGTYIGHSPLVVDALAAGRHSVSLTKTGWSPQDLDVAVVAGNTALSSVQLQRVAARNTRSGAGFIAIKGLVPRTLTIDGQALKPDKTGAYGVTSGMHRLIAETTLGKMSRDVTVYPEMRTDVVLRDDADVRSVVVAPASDFMPLEAIKLEGTRITIHHGGHEVIARLGQATYRLDGRSVEFDSPPTLIGSKLYLPLELLTTLTANDAKAK